MKNINVNELQNNISKVLKEVEDGDVFEVVRYSKPVAYLISKSDFDNLSKQENCKKCVSDLRKVVSIVEKSKEDK
ncbi:MAG: type II toxin-antitoxin system prevent-host-death family antitoxin [Patescibacteria group bacterium]|jgi:prevent-host-death family protein